MKDLENALAQARKEDEKKEKQAALEQKKREEQHAKRQKEEKAMVETNIKEWPCLEWILECNHPEDHEEVTRNLQHVAWKSVQQRYAERCASDDPRERLLWAESLASNRALLFTGLPAQSVSIHDYSKELLSEVQPGAMLSRKSAENTLFNQMFTKELRSYLDEGRFDIPWHTMAYANPAYMFLNDADALALLDEKHTANKLVERNP